MVCPNHDASQICPDCTMQIGQPRTGRNYFIQTASPANEIERYLPPLEQHKADLEMIIAACVTEADKTGEAACTSIAKLANGMLIRLDSQRGPAMPKQYPGCYATTGPARCFICKGWHAE